MSISEMAFWAVFLLPIFAVRRRTGLGHQATYYCCGTLYGEEAESTGGSGVAGKIERSGVRRIAMKVVLRLHRIAIEARYRIDLSSSFDALHYKSRYGDIGGSGIDAIDHYLYFGVREQRSPHPLFDSQFYLSRYPEVSKSRIDPFVHYLAFGWKEGRDPHPAFCGRYYLHQVPSLLQGSISPISHYSNVGWKLNLSPHPLFDGGRYLAAAPDVKGAGINPLIHFLWEGLSERRRIHPSAANPDDYEDSCRAFEDFTASALPSGPSDLESSEWASAFSGPTCAVRETGFLEAVRPSRKLGPTALEDATPIDVIVPCYRGVEETILCLESLLRSGLKQRMEIVVIDDDSPESRLSEFLQRLAVENRITLIRHETNLGFVGSVNEGMALHPSRDVVLLNSDTIVPKGWLDRLAQAAHSIPRAATVTPLSNNATICSYPAFCRGNPMPPGHDVESLDRLTAEVNSGRMVEIPTAVGFCMFIRRASLDELGFFDDIAFGRGYGEENDFCMRASRRGWSHWLALDLFVYHSGSVSFLGESPSLQIKASETICERYPDYETVVARHVEANPAAGYRFALSAAIYRSSGKPVLLMVTNAIGGGVDVQFDDFQSCLCGDSLFLTLRPAGRNQVALTVPGHVEAILFPCDERGYQDLADLLRLFRVTAVHVHNLIGYTIDFQTLRDRLAVPLDSVFHNSCPECPSVRPTT